MTVTGRNPFQERFSRWWLALWAGYFFILYLAFHIFFSVARRGNLQWQNIRSFLAVSAVMALIICLFGYFRARVGYIVLNLFTLAGIVSLYAAWLQPGGGWDDPLRGPSNMFFLFACGILLAFVAELGWLGIRKLFGIPPAGDGR